MTGWRIGFAAGPKEIITAMTNIQSQSTSNATSIAQKAAVEALTGPQSSVETMRAAFDTRRKFLVSAVNSIPGMSCITPTGAFYSFPNTSRLYGRAINGRTISSSSDLAVYLLDHAKVALVHGDAFGDDNYIRLSYATSMENLSKGVERIREAMSKLV
jgi:aspartate aminotransferase